MEKLLKSIGIKLPWLKDLGICDDDRVDRLSHRTTAIMLVILSIIVSSKQFVGSAINCWVPAHFTGEQLDYTNDFCWIRNTYYLPHTEDIPAHDTRDHIPYYQWVALILLVQSFLFYLPFLLWNVISSHSGIDIKNLVEAGHIFVATEMNEIKDKTLSHMTVQMDRFLNHMNSRDGLGWTLSIKHLFKRINCCRCHGNRRSGISLSVLYVLVKLIYVLNALGQLFLLDVFLGFNYHSYGIDVMTAALNGQDWSESSTRFPRTAMCDLKVRRLGDVHRYTVECVLPINLFNEKIFLFLWFWIVGIIIITSLSLLTWIIRLSRAAERRHYVRQHLRFKKKVNSDQDRKQLRRFVDKYLRPDGVFVLRVLASNTDIITVTEFINDLWKNFTEKRRHDDQETVTDAVDGDRTASGNKFPTGLCALACCKNQRI